MALTIEEEKLVKQTMANDVRITACQKAFRVLRKAGKVTDDDLIIWNTRVRVYNAMVLKTFSNPEAIEKVFVRELERVVDCISKGRLARLPEK